MALRSSIEGFTFLYPDPESPINTTTHTLDRICYQLVTALEVRGWNVPGITVEFETYGSGECWYHMVKSIRGSDFAIRFGRFQRKLGASFNDDAAASSIVYPRGTLTMVRNQVFHPNKFYLFDWYLRRTVCLDNEESVARPSRTSARQATDTAIAHLVRVLDRINVQPETGSDQSRFAPVPTPVPANLPPMFTLATHKEGERIQDCKQAPDTVSMSHWYAFHGDQALLARCPLPYDDVNQTLGRQAATWCGIGKVDDKQLAELDIPGYMGMRDHYVVRIIPQRADGVYVADHGAWEKLGEQLLQGSDRYLTDEELLQLHTARLDTLVPLTDYDGSYEQPVVLFFREVNIDEVEIISGPWRAYGTKLCSDD